MTNSDPQTSRNNRLPDITEGVVTDTPICDEIFNIGSSDFIRK